MVDNNDAELAEVVALIHERNTIDARIGAVLNRPATVGDMGEWIAAHIFEIKLAAAANNAAFDGHFTTSPLVGKTVNVKTYLRQYGSLDLTENDTVDYYLVFTGPKSNLGSSRGTQRPFCIESVYLFEAKALLAEIRDRGKKADVATGIAVAQWRAAQIYPEPSNSSLVLTDKQRRQLEMFQP
nr:hypothetical protein [Mycobacterium sp. UM_NZ2]